MRAEAEDGQCEAHCGGGAQLKATIWSRKGNAQSDGRGVRTRWETRREGRLKGKKTVQIQYVPAREKEAPEIFFFNISQADIFFGPICIKVKVTSKGSKSHL